jgi:hypothetical protein
MNTNNSLPEKGKNKILSSILQVVALILIILGILGLTSGDYGEMLLLVVGVAIFYFFPSGKSKSSMDPKNQYICTVCNYIGTPKREAKGSVGVEIVLWIFFIIPGLIYSIWRVSNKTLLCPKCKSDHMIPLDTPMGQKLVNQK